MGAATQANMASAQTGHQIDLNKAAIDSRKAELEHEAMAEKVRQEQMKTEAHASREQRLSDQHADDSLARQAKLANQGQEMSRADDKHQLEIAKVADDAETARTMAAIKAAIATRESDAKIETQKAVGQAKAKAASKPKTPPKGP